MQPSSPELNPYGPFFPRGVAFNQVGKTEEIITKKYDVSKFHYLFKVCPNEERNEILIKIVRVSGETLLKCGLIGGSIGVAVGVGTAVCISRVELAVPFAFYGGTIGFGIGALAGGVFGLASEYIKIDQSVQFLNWKQGETKEKYSLFLDCMKKYVGNDFPALFCPLTKDVPSIPVLGRNHIIYDKAAIEEYLDQYWERQEKNIPIHWTLEGDPFHKEDLQYACKFAEDASNIFKSIKNKITITDNEDFFLLEALEKLLNSYKENHKAITDTVIMNLTREATLCGATQEQLKNILKVFQEHCNQG